MKLSNSHCALRTRIWVDRPGQTSRNEEDLPGQFSVDSIKSHEQALKGHEQVTVMFSALFPAAVKVVRSTTGGFIVAERLSDVTGCCVQGR